MDRIIHCPEETCEHHKNEDEGNVFFYQNGFYKLKNGSRVRRLLCKSCGTKFSTATFKDTYRQKRPDLNFAVFKLLASGVTLRRSAKILECDRKTIVRKLIFLSEKIRKLHGQFLEDYFTGTVQFDEMETYEGAKAKQLSIALAICANSGKILEINACRKPTTGRLADLGKEHYGWTVDERKACASGVLAVVSSVTNEKLKIVCDKKPQYPKWIHAHKPHAEIVQVKSRGRKKSIEMIEPKVAPSYEDEMELEEEEAPANNLVEEGRKVKGFDEMFRLNHTCAKIRADLSRMRRKTWACTKKLFYLNHHLMLYVGWNNEYEL
jgi:hypothetical protein